MNNDDLKKLAANPFGAGRRVGHSIFNTIRRAKSSVRPSATINFNEGFEAGKASVAQSTNVSKLTNLIQEKLPLALGIAGVGLAISQSDKLVNKGVEAVEKARYRNTMDTKIDKLIMLNPQLAKYDREVLKLYYDQLHHFAPHIANNSLAAASYMQSILAAYKDTGTPINIIDTIAKIQSYGDKRKDGNLKLLMPGLNSASSDIDFKGFLPSGK